VIFTPVQARYFRFTALQEVNGNGWTSAAEITVLPCSNPSQTTPQNLAAARLSTTKISLAWSPVPQATGYNVKRATTGGGPYTIISANQSAASYIDSNLSSSTTYYYVVSAITAGGESTNSSQVAVVAPLFWQSAETYGGGLGEQALTISPQDGTWSEPRAGGVHRLLVNFGSPIAPASFTPSAVSIAGNGVTGALNLAGITITTSLRSGNTVGVIDFSPSLPDVARYAVQLVGVMDASGTLLTGDTQCLLTALKGDMTGDLKVTTADLSWMGPNYAIHVNPSNSAQLRADYNQDGSVNVYDVSSLWNDGRTHDASGISNPAPAAVVAPSPPALSASTVIDGTTVVVASTDTLGPAGNSLTVQNGGALNLGQTSQSLATVTLAGGSISNGTLNATAYNLSQGIITANLAGQGAALVKTGSSTVFLSGANSYTGGTKVLAGTLIIANAASLPDGGDLVVGNESLFTDGSVLPANASQAAAVFSAPAAVPAVTAPTNVASTAAIAATPGTSTSAERDAAIARVLLGPQISTPKLIANRAWLAAVAQYWNDTQRQGTVGSTKTETIDIALIARNE
jgi:autotransporter-associated beta strand protein